MQFSRAYNCVKMWSVYRCLPEDILLNYVTTKASRLVTAFTLFVYTLQHCILQAPCARLVRRSNFRHQASPRVSPRESTQRQKVELKARNVL
jgi:hypothetical protein